MNITDNRGRIGGELAAFVLLFSVLAVIVDHLGEIINFFSELMPDSGPPDFSYVEYYRRMFGSPITWIGLSTGWVLVLAALVSELFSKRRHP